MSPPSKENIGYYAAFLTANKDIPDWNILIDIYIMVIELSGVQFV